MTIQRSSLHVIAGFSAVYLLSGCSGTAGTESGSISSTPTPFIATNSEVACADWIPFDSVDHAAANADLVVRADLQSSNTTVIVHGEKASLHHAIVTEVFVGAARIGDVLSVVSTPASCTAGAPYPGGDPMLRDDATLALKQGIPAPSSANFFETITPYAGVWDERPTAD